MFSEGHWPFYPDSLSEIFDPDTLSLIGTGSSVLMGRPLTLLDFNPVTGGFTRRIHTINEKDRFVPFCRELRKDSGCDLACQEWDIAKANDSLALHLKSGNLSRWSPCHMNLIDLTRIVQIRGRPVAMLFTGQYAPPEGPSPIQNALSGDNAAAITIEPDKVGYFHELAADLEIFNEAEANEKLEKAAAHLQRLAEDKYERGKHHWEQEFLASLRHCARGKPVDSREKLQEQLGALLRLVCEFLHCQYAVFFGGLKENDTVLAPIAAHGSPVQGAADLPHFNWKKAGLQETGFNITAINLEQWFADIKSRAIRGNNQELFDSARIALPVTLSRRNYGVLVLGPFSDDVDLQQESNLLVDISNTVGLFALSGLDVLYLEQERRLWKNSSILLVHQMKTILMTVNTDIGRVRESLQFSKSGLDHKRLDGFLKQAEDRIMLLATSANETLKQGTMVFLHPEDMEMEPYSLSVLVSNCAYSYIEKARSEHRELVLEPSVEWLPDVNIDVARLSVVLSNLIDNAIKYSFANTKIFIRGQIIMSNNAKQIAVVEVDDLGSEIRMDEQDKIFEQGFRSDGVLKGRRIPGSGLGLWEAKLILAAHGGQIKASCEPTPIYRREGRAYRAVFSLTLPVREKK